MVIHIINRIVPWFMLAAAAYFHLSYCEWDIRNGREHVSSQQNQRAIYYRRTASRQVFLLAKSLEEKDEAQLYGVVLPAMLALFAIGVLHFTRPDERNRRSVLWQDGSSG